MSCAVAVIIPASITSATISDILTVVLIVLSTGLALIVWAPSSEVNLVKVGSLNITIKSHKASHGKHDPRIHTKPARGKTFVFVRCDFVDRALNPNYTVLTVK